MTRVNRWECDQCGAHITGKERLYHIKLEEPFDRSFKGEMSKIRCRKKDMCHTCFDAVLYFLKIEKEEEKVLKDGPLNIQLSTIERIGLEEEKK